MVERWSIISLGLVLLAIRWFGGFVVVSVINNFNITIYGIDHVKVYKHTCMVLAFPS